MQILISLFLQHCLVRQYISHLCIHGERGREEYCVSLCDWLSHLAVMSMVRDCFIMQGEEGVYKSSSVLLLAAVSLFILSRIHFPVATLYCR